MKILVVSGFLGAGKTTFIQNLAKNTKKEFVILENEFSDVNVDGKLFQEQQDTIINIWELTEGCVCCSTQADFASSILTIANTIDPEYLVVEPTGIGQLSRIINNVKKLEYERIQLLAPLTILDGRLFEKYMSNYQEIYVDQIQSASTVVVSHFEGSSPEEQQDLEEKLRKINPTSPILTEHYSKQEQTWWTKLLEKGLDGRELLSKAIHLEEMEQLGLTTVTLDWEMELICFLEWVIRGRFGKIIRGKGFLQIGQNWLRFDVVDSTYTITGIPPQEDTRAVFIGEQLQRNEIRKVLQKQFILEK